MQTSHDSKKTRLKLIHLNSRTINRSTLLRTDTIKSQAHTISSTMEKSEADFVTFYGAKESIPRNRFRQPM
jgi:hypothetical protein